MEQPSVFQTKTTKLDLKDASTDNNPIASDVDHTYSNTSSFSPKHSSTSEPVSEINKKKIWTT